MHKSLLHRPFFESPAFARYRDELAVWLESGADEDTLDEAVRDVVRSIWASGMQPEHLIAGLHEEAFGGELAPDAGAAAPRSRRYVRAVGRLMRTCYGREPQLCVVQGTDGRTWTVMPIDEGARWDPEIEMRRRGWLCCVTSGDRRYISPVPGDWERRTEVEIACEIANAKPDLRGA